MSSKFKIIVITTFIAFLVMIYPYLIYSQEENINAKVYSLKGEPMFIENLRYGGKQYFDASWRESTVKLFYKDIKIIKFVGPKKNMKIEVTFRNGRVDNFVLMTGNWYMTGMSEFGKWNMLPGKVNKIEFMLPGENQQININETAKFDIVLLKNGDTISGEIKNSILKLRTSYGLLNFKIPQISYIEFEGGGQNIDVIVLRIGDKLSGVVEEQMINVVMSSGTELSLDKEKIKRISFKK